MSASLSAVTVAVDAWIATWVTAVWIAHDSAISVCILYNSLLLFWSAYVNYLRHLLLTPCNVISLQCTGTDVAEYAHLLSAYLQLYV